MADRASRRSRAVPASVQAGPGPLAAKAYTFSPLRLFALGLLLFAAGFAVGVGLFVATSAPGRASDRTAMAAPAGGGAAPSVQLPTPAELQTVDGLRAHLQHAPDDVAARLELANALFDAGSYAEAATHYEQVLQSDPENADVRTDLGVAYRNTRRAQQAVECFRRAIRSQPDHRNAHYNLGVVLAHDVNDAAGAIEAWDHYLELAPDAANAADVRASLAELHRRLGR
jgi:tetratricopeptide (TPR) repeat protein